MEPNITFDKSCDEIKTELEKQDIDIQIKVDDIGKDIVKAAENEDLETLRYLIKSNKHLIKYLRSFFEDAFMSALNFKYDNVIEVFLEHGLSLTDHPLNQSIIALTKISKYILFDPPIELLTLLLKYGCDVNYPEQKKYRTPLHIACRQGNLPFVKILVENGADINAIDKKKMMPLNYTEERMKQNPKNNGYKEIKEFLESKGAERDWKKDLPKSQCFLDQIVELIFMSYITNTFYM